MTNAQNPGSSEAMGPRPEKYGCSAPGYSVPDDKLENRVARVLVWNALVPANAIRATAQNGRITLTGHVEFEYQRHAAEAAIRPLCGVFAVANNVTVGRIQSQHTR